MDAPTSMIVPDAAEAPDVLCGRCWSSRLRFYGGEYEGQLAVMVLCENCGNRTIYPLLELPQSPDGGANG